MELGEIIESEEFHLKKLNELVSEAIKEEQLLTKKLAEVEADQALTLGEKLADRVAEFGGSWLFIIFFLLFMLIWIGYNIYFYSLRPFDPYPFILLNLILSCLAAMQAPIIMMSQNRQDERDRRRSRGDYLVNLKAEMEIRSLNRKIDLLMSEEMQSLFKIQRAQLDLLKSIQDKFNGPNQN